MTLSSQQPRTSKVVQVSAHAGKPAGPGAGGGVIGGVSTSRKPRRSSGLTFGKVIAIAAFVLIAGSALGYLVLHEGSNRNPKPGATTGSGLASTSTIGPSTNPLASPPAASPPPFELSMAPTQPRPGTASVADPAATTPMPKPGPAVAPGSGQPGSSQPGSAQPGATPPTGTQPIRDPLAPSTPAPAPGQAPNQPGAQPGSAPGMQPATPVQPPSGVQSFLAEAERLQAQNKLVDARATLNKALLNPAAGASDRAAIRKWMSELNQSLVFSPDVAPGDTLSETYSVVSGDNIEKIMKKERLAPDKMLIARVNKMSDPNKLRVGQKLKLVKGPFHAVVVKSAFRIDIYAGDSIAPGAAGSASSGAADGAEPNWLYITSFPVGLGAPGADGKTGTPTGTFIVKAGSKLINPHWVNPRTGEKFDANDPKNPIGERWIGLEGLDDASKKFTGYGVHGTIEPESIGREMSMGCVRLNAADIEVVYDLLTPRVSVVKIIP